MASYFVSTIAKENGDHEVFAQGCSWMPDSSNRMYLGEFSNCIDAMREARKHYQQVNGCYYCCTPCHTQ